MLIVDSDEEGPSNSADGGGDGDDRARKRKLEENEGACTKKSRLEQTEDLDDVIALD